MTLDAETTKNIDSFAARLDAIAELQALSEDHLQGLRQSLYSSEQLNRDQIERLFGMHKTRPATDTLWIEFFIEALAERFLTKQGDRLYLTAEAEQDLIDMIGDQTPIVDLGLRRLVLRLLFRSTETSERFQRLAFDMVHHHLMQDRCRLLIDLPRQAGTVDIVDLQLIRKLIYGAGGQYPRPVSRVAVDFLLDLDQTSPAFIDQAAWQHLFLKAMSHHLINDQDQRDHADIEIDEGAALWLAERIEAGRTGPNTNSLVQLLAQEISYVPPCLATLLADGH